jgi:hypothetical protein
VIEDPRGAGAYTLCRDCNLRCARYAQHFIKWAVFLQTALDVSPPGHSITASPLTRRSRIMKQVDTMTLSACPLRQERSTRAYSNPRRAFDPYNLSRDVIPFPLPQCTVCAPKWPHRIELKQTFQRQIAATNGLRVRWSGGNNSVAEQHSCTRPCVQLRSAGVLSPF